MNKSTLWSLRLGFSAKNSEKIESMGLEKFLGLSYDSDFRTELPEILYDEPKTLAEFNARWKRIRQLNEAERKELVRSAQKKSMEMKAWWLDRIRSAELPLREKMVVFWHNHFVSSMNKVRHFIWIYQHNMTLREHAFGNFRELTKLMIRSNAIVHYLDNRDNRRGSLNENLSRELLELFTLGEGNYTERDIREGAKALAGLDVGDDHAQYRPRWRYNGFVEYMGRRGKYDSDDIIDIIFEHPESPYLITRKIMQWFLYDQPEEEWVRYYGDYLRQVDFEIEPFFTKMMTEEAERNLQGRKIKDPLMFMLQITDELQLKEPDNRSTVFFLQAQGMDLFNQPNVKGWDGGKAWITSQILLQRNQLTDMLCRGRIPGQRMANQGMMQKREMGRFRKIDVAVRWDDSKTPAEIINSLSDRLLFDVNDDLQGDMEELLKYDFDTMSANADQSVLRLFNYIVNTPEFQLI